MVDRLYSDNITLRRLQETDCDDFFAITGDEKVMHPIPQPVMTKEESDAHLLELLHQSDVNLFAIEFRQNKEFIGIIALVRDNELVYRLKPAYWGKGIGQESVSAFLNHLIKDLGLKYITAEANKSNVASVKILSRFMIKTGEYFNKELNCVNCTFKKVIG